MIDVDLQSPASSPLGSDYVEHLLQRLQSAGYARLPSPDTAVNAFNTLGNRPEEFRRALRQMYKTQQTLIPICVCPSLPQRCALLPPKRISARWSSWGASQWPS